MCMWINRETAKGHEVYLGTIEGANNILANLTGEWTLEVAVVMDDTETLYMMASNREKEWDEVKWEKGLSVMCVMRYNEEKVEKEVTLEMMVTLQTDEGENFEKEMEILVAMLRAWVEEKVFPNARMAVNARELLGIKEIQKSLVEINLPAFIWSKGYHL